MNATSSFLNVTSGFGVEKSPSTASGCCAGSSTTRAMSVSFHLLYSSRWHDSHAADPTNVFAAVVAAGGAGGGGEVHAATVSAMTISAANALACCQIGLLPSNDICDMVARTRAITQAPPAPTRYFERRFMRTVRPIVRGSPGKPT